ncbi:hypothetical protein [Desulforegula conservatrix]|uniref:hypothetical protein n=1 Tax=Desulforegula conservatrix TaxID=153026 RepID=UPI0004874451|nr:hypothetical protein [Desulforegula conservatrix]
MMIFLMNKTKMAPLLNLKVVPKRMHIFAQNQKVVPMLVSDSNPAKTQQIPALPTYFQLYPVVPKRLLLHIHVFQAGCLWSEETCL